MRNQTVYLPLIFAVDLVQEVKSQNVLADGDLITVLKYHLGDPVPVQCGSVSRAEIGENVIVSPGLGI